MHDLRTIIARNANPEAAIAASKAQAIEVSPPRSNSALAIRREQNAAIDASRIQRA